MQKYEFGDGINENHSVMLKILCSQRSGLKIVHFNARSLNGLKLDYVKDVFNNSNIDLICVSESWFKQNVDEKHYEINGYNLYHNSRTNRKGGGVAIYCKNNIKSKLVNKSADSDVEFINIEVYDHMTKILVSCVYNPHRSICLEQFFSDFNQRAIDYDFFVTCGDFNVNILNKDKIKDDFCDLVSLAGLSFVNREQPTRFSPNCCPSLIDCMLVSDESLIMLFDQISFVSDHDLLFCTLNVNFHKSVSPSLVTFRDYSSIDYPWG